MLLDDEEFRPHCWHVMNDRGRGGIGAMRTAQINAGKKRRKPKIHHPKNDRRFDRAIAAGISPSRAAAGSALRARRSSLPFVSPPSGARDAM
jgi:hypothetical protein